MKKPEIEDCLAAQEPFDLVLVLCGRRDHELKRTELEQKGLWGGGRGADGAPELLFNYRYGVKEHQKGNGTGRKKKRSLIRCRNCRQWK